MNYDILDVSRYIIDYSNKMDYGVSNLKLQKLLYFVQAYFLIQTGHPCFKEKIEAWDFWPVVPKAYQEYKQYGCGDIPTTKSFIMIDKDNIWNSKRVKFEDTAILDYDKSLINKVVDKFSEYSATDMVKLTQHQSPWIDAIVSNRSNEITNESIFEYFNGTE